jgi:hypothetical protein
MKINELIPRRPILPFFLSHSFWLLFNFTRSGQPVRNRKSKKMKKHSEKCIEFCIPTHVVIYICGLCADLHQPFPKRLLHCPGGVAQWSPHPPVVQLIRVLIPPWFKIFIENIAMLQ